MKPYHIYEIGQVLIIPLYVISYDKENKYDSKVSSMTFSSGAILTNLEVSLHNFTDDKISKDIEDYRTVIKNIFTLKKIKALN